MIDARIVKKLPPSRMGSAFELDIHLQSDSAVTVILGPSGAGKTLTLNCLAGFARPDKGRILVQDQLFFDAEAKVHVPPHKRRCGYIFQDHTLFPHMSVRENLKFAAQSMPRPRLSRLEQQRTMNDLLEAFELAELVHRMPHQLSGGQKQRVAIARVLLGSPRLLLLDEPARGLNLQLREAFYDILRRARERLKAPIVIVTHDIEECFSLAGNLYFLENGHCLQSGRKEDVIARPASLEVARLLGIHVVVPAEIVYLDPGRDLSRIRLANQEIETRYLPGQLRGDRGWLCVRRGDLKVLPYPPEPESNQLVLEWRSETATVHGVRLEFEGGLSAEVRESELQEWRASRALRIEFPPQAVHFLSS
ncbi:MAG: ATP-binding cassette domain-containing protein [Bryobacteraceae bacterium]